MRSCFLLVVAVLFVGCGDEEGVRVSRFTGTWVKESMVTEFKKAEKTIIEAVKKAEQEKKEGKEPTVDPETMPNLMCQFMSIQKGTEEGGPITSYSSDYGLEVKDNGDTYYVTLLQIPGMSTKGLPYGRVAKGGDVAVFTKQKNSAVVKFKKTSGSKMNLVTTRLIDKKDADGKLIKDENGKKVKPETKVETVVWVKIDSFQLSNIREEYLTCFEDVQKKAE